jgi:ketosteroid isomerase-like protein
MSRENVERVEALVGAWNRGDRDGWLAGAHPDVEWSSAIQREVEGSDVVYRGRAEVGRFWEEWHALWHLDIEVSELRDLGDTVVALAQIRTRSKTSGAEVERSVGYVCEFEGALLRKLRAYLSPQEALKAAGLPE